MIRGSGGGGKSGGGSGSVRASSRKADPYEQSLRSQAVAEVVELLCEGPILGLVAEIDEGDAYKAKSIAFDETPLMAADGTDNVTGYHVRLRKGTANQLPIKTNYGLQTTTTFDPSLELTEVGVSQEINMPDADSLKILLYAPAFYGQNKRDGSFYDANVMFSILVNGYEAYHTGFSGQTTGAYQRQYELTDLSRFGSNPWTVQIVLDEGYYHENQTYLHDRVYWTAVVGVTAEQFSWPYVAHASLQVGARQFGGNIPARAYEIYGFAQCPMPDVYDPDSTDEDRCSGTWDGETWQYEWTDNPAWCFLAMLTNERFGLGISLDDVGVLKWQLCKIARYCDEFVPLAGGGSERRWTFNHILQTQEEAFHVLNSLASAFLATPLWASNEVLIMQDAPDDSDHPEDVNYSHMANQTNVIDGAFNYSGSAINAKHTVARITWNDPNDFNRPKVAYYEDAAGIKRYGWRPKDVVAVGCNSYSQALRYGRWVIDTELNEGDLVTFIGDMSFGDCTPGNRIAVMDPYFADIRFGGRVTYAQTVTGFSYITLDDAITLEAGITYTLHLCIPLPKDEKPAEQQEQVVQVISAEVLTAASTTNYLKIAEQSVLPAIGSYWYISEPNLNPRYFTCLVNEPQPGQQHKITALYHDYSKYARIYRDTEQNPVAPESYVPTGVIVAPEDLDATEYAYESGNNWRPGVLLDWSHIDDPRVIYYQVDRKRLDADEAELAWRCVGETQECSFNVQPCRAGDWAFRVRGRGTLTGEWAEIESFTVVGKGEDPPDVTGLQVKGGGTTFTDKDLHIEWDTVVDEDYMPASRFWRYQVNIYDTDDNLKWTELRTKERMTFSRSENLKAFGTLTREFKVGVSALDIYRNASATETIITVSNPAPDMSAFTPTIKELTTGLRIDWSGWDDSAISDLKQFRIYCDTSNPPTTLVAKLAAHRDRYKYDDGIKSYASHYVQIVPYDEFGEGVASIVAASSGQDVDIDKPIELSTDGKIVAGTPDGARVEYSATELAGYSDETTKEFEISTADGKIKAGGGSVLIDATGITISQGGDKVNRISWTSGANKVTGTDMGEYTCILNHVSSNDDKPVTGANWATYWAKTGDLGYGFWYADYYYHAAETDNISMLYGYDDPGNNRVYTTLHTRGDYVGASAETRIRARCAEGKTASVYLYVNDKYIKLSQFGSNTAKLEIPSGVELHTYGDLYTVGNADVYVTGGVSIGSLTNENPRIGDLWVQSGIHVGYQSYADPGDGRVIAEGYIETASKFVSTLATGNKPIDVASTTVCTNLNADMVDGKHAGGANGLATLGAGGLVPTSQLGTGTADNTVFLRGDGTWQAVGAGASFNDAEGDPADVGTKTDGTSSYGARRDHGHAAPDATTSTKGFASFSPINFTVSSGAVSLATNGVPFVALPAFDTDKILGRSDSGSGPPSQITCTAAGRALLDDATAADQRTTLSLGNCSTLNVGTTTGTVAAGDDSRFVTGGNSHDHNGGDGAQISHANLSNIGTNSHSTIDSFISSKAQASGLASLDATGTVVQNPANATAEAAPWKIAVADGNAKLDSWISTATTSTKGLASFSSTYFDVTTGAVSLKSAGVAYSRIQNVSATDKLLGRVSAGAGSIEEITCTAAGRALLDDASAAAQCTTLGLGTSSTPQFERLGIGTTAPTSGTHQLKISDASAGDWHQTLLLLQPNLPNGYKGAGVAFGRDYGAELPYGYAMMFFTPDATTPTSATQIEWRMVGTNTLAYITGAGLLGARGGLKTAGGGLDGTLGTVSTLHHVNYPTSYTHNVATSHSSTAANNHLAFNLCNGGAGTTVEVLRLVGNGCLGLGVAAPAYDITFAQGAARTVGIQRRTDSDSAGNFLYVRGGDATIAATNRNGGTLHLQPGLCTGSGYGRVKIYGCLGPGSGSPTTDGTLQTLIDCCDSRIGFFDATPAVKQTLAAYTSDPESSAYTTTGSGSDIASKADLNTLRAAYETLRAMCEDLRTKLLATTLIGS